MFVRGQCHITNHVEAMPATDSPPGHDTDHYFGHEANETLHFQDVETPGSGRVDLLPVRVPVTVPPAYPLVTAGTEGPTSVLGRGPVPGEEDTADIGGLPGMVEGGEELIDGVRPKGVSDLGSVEGDPDHTGVLGAVIGDVGEIEAGHHVPSTCIEYLRDHEARG
jgi:hypothetical protein